jgi:hypothetical protein
MDIFVGLAGIMRQEDQQGQPAMELLSMALDHPASTQNTRLAAQQLAELTSAATGELLKRASAPGQNLDWQVTASQLTG